MRPEIKNWWKQALEDLDTAKYNFNGKKYEVAAFFSQQASEKALKALYIKKFGDIRKTHDLVLLARKLDLPKNIVDLCKELGPAYVYTRYPDVVKVDKIKEQSEKLLEYAEEVLKWIERTL